LALVREDELGDLVRMAHEEEGRPATNRRASANHVRVALRACNRRVNDAGNAPAPAGSAERIWREIQSAKASGRSLAERAISEARETLWGAGATVRPRPRLRYFSGSGLEVIGGDGSVVAGIDLMVPHPGENRDVLASRAATPLSLAPFFREFHLAFAPNAGDDAPDRAEALLEWPSYSWIGVIVVDQEGWATV
jgi:hypothetical protein